MGARARVHANSKKKYERHADIAFWYGIDPGRLTTEEQIGYLANLERVKAQQTIHSGNYDPTDWRGVHHLYLLAYGDWKLADKARARAMELLIERKCGEHRT